MIVASNLLPGTPHDRDPSRRVRYESGYPWPMASRYSLDHPSTSAKCWLGGSNPSHRTLRDGSSLAIIPGNEFPGYDHIVPYTGHHKQDAAPRFKGDE
jgi:hypothetical protein